MKKITFVGGIQFTNKINRTIVLHCFDNFEKNKESLYITKNDSEQIFSL